jgi:hypothetical protein
MVETTICGYCSRSFSYKRRPIPLYCSKRCLELGHKQKLANKRIALKSITTCRTCHTNIEHRKWLAPICKACKKKNKQDRQKQICTITKSKQPIESIKPPEYMERGDLCFLKENRRIQHE